MWLRCQIGSKSPLANRNARMFCAASLPRKWSIRKIWSSLKTRCSSLFSDLERRQVDAERLLHDDPAARDQVGLLEDLHDVQRGLRRHAQVVQPVARPVAARRLVGLVDDGLQPVGARLPGRPPQPLLELLPVLLLDLVRRELVDRPAGELEERVAVVLVEGGADDLEVAQQPGLEQVQQARQQLALGQVARGPDEDDRDGRCRHAPQRGISTARSRRACTSRSSPTSTATSRRSTPCWRTRAASTRTGSSVTWSRTGRGRRSAYVGCVRSPVWSRSAATPTATRSRHHPTR